MISRPMGLTRNGWASRIWKGEKRYSHLFECEYFLGGNEKITSFITYFIYGWM